MREKPCPSSFALRLPKGNIGPKGQKKAGKIALDAQDVERLNDVRALLRGEEEVKDADPQD